jgi:hypothetical protein
MFVQWTTFEQTIVSTVLNNRAEMSWFVTPDYEAINKMENFKDGAFILHPLSF